MNFSQSLKTCLVKKYFTLEGRASRSEFWKFTIFSIVVNFTLSVVFSFLSIIQSFAATGTNTSSMVTLLGLIEFISFIILLALQPPIIAAWVRRMHDVNKNGAWYVIPYSIHMTILVLGVLSSIGGDVAMISGYITLANFTLVVLALPAIFMAFKQGTVGDNTYGTAPLIVKDDELVAE